jgi:hypothetical protein
LDDRHPRDVVEVNERHVARDREAAGAGSRPGRSPPCGCPSQRQPARSRRATRSSVRRRPHGRDR